MNDIHTFHQVTNQCRDFFLSKGYTEVHPQMERRILAACEDPKTIGTYTMDGTVFPLPQTGQMALERFMLQNPNENGFFCVTTSYRDEPNPIPGRHDKIFPMFEFETKGDMNTLQTLEKDLLTHIGFSNFTEGDYEDVCKKYDVDEVDDRVEGLLTEDGSVFFLKNFPNRSNPYWNMLKNDNGKTFNKIDVIVHGMETIGSAERAVNREQMEHEFNIQSDGEYKKLIFDLFGEDRVRKELKEYLNYDFIQRCGGGIGLTRLFKGVEKERRLKESQ